MFFSFDRIFFVFFYSLFLFKRFLLSHECFHRQVDTFVYTLMLLLPALTITVTAVCCISPCAVAFFPFFFFLYYYYFLLILCEESFAINLCMISSCKAQKRKSARDIVYVFYTHTESERHNLLTAHTNGVEQHKRTRECICVSVGWLV